MKIVRYAKYVGTMIGPEGHVHRWTTPRERFFQRTRKINGTSKCLVKRLIDFKIYALSVLGHWGSISAPDGATLKEEAPALQCTTVGPTIIPTDLLRAGSVCGLGIDQVEIRILNLAARFRTAASSNALASSLQKSWQPESTTVSPCSLSPPEWEEKFLKTPMAHSTMEAYEYARHLGHACRIADSPSDKKQKAATVLLRDAIQKRCFFPDHCTCLPNLGTDQQTPQGTNHTDDLYFSTCLRPGLAVGILRVLCNGMSTANPHGR